MNSETQQPRPRRGVTRFVLLGALLIVMATTIAAAARGSLPLPVPPQAGTAAKEHDTSPGDTENAATESSCTEHTADDAVTARPILTTATTAALATTTTDEAGEDVADTGRVRYLLSENNDVAATETRPDASGVWTQWSPGISTPYLLDVRLPEFDAMRPLNGITIILDPGHGGKDPGTAGFDSSGNEFPEKTFNLSLARRVASLLEAQGAHVIPTRTDDEWVSLYSRIAQAGQHATSIWQALLEQINADTAWIGAIDGGFQVMRSINEDTAGSGGRGMAQGVGMNETMRKAMDMQRQLTNTIYVSIHANASTESTEVRGFQVYYTSSDAVYASEGERVRTQPDGDDTKPISPFYPHYDNEARRALATAVAQALGEAVPELNKHAEPVANGNYAYLREINYNAIMLEAGFMSNAADLALLLDESVQQRLAEGLVRGLAAYVESLAS